jgi:hypothetical protein
MISHVTYYLMCQVKCHLLYMDDEAPTRATQDGAALGWSGQRRGSNARTWCTQLKLDRVCKQTSNSVLAQILQNRPILKPIRLTKNLPATVDSGILPTLALGMREC